jgi:hypothetical protein
MVLLREQSQYFDCSRSRWLYCKSYCGATKVRRRVTVHPQSTLVGVKSCAKRVLCVLRCGLYGTGLKDNARKLIGFQSVVGLSCRVALPVAPIWSVPKVRGWKRV